MTETRLARPDEVRAVLRAVLRTRQKGSVAALERQLDELFALMAKPGRCAGAGHAITLRDGKVLAACLCFDSPGRVGMVFLPALGSAAWQADALADAVRCVVRSAGTRGVAVLQAILEEGDVREARLLSVLGFHHLAKLLYLDRRGVRSFRKPRGSMAVAWRTYVQNKHALFAQTIARTYEGSLDCPGLTGLREIEDVLASHKATGEHDPQHWFLAAVEGEAVGVLLLARVPLRSAMEIVYMGVVPARRGEGFGDILLAKALEVARQEAADCLTLAVDANNAPALRLYKRFGFETVAFRHAWIRLVKAVH